MEREADALQAALDSAHSLTEAGWGRRLVLPETGSTQAEMWAALDRDPAGWENGVVVALRQTSGRGRLGRVWSSPEGNLCFSMAHKRVEPPCSSPCWSPLAGLAVVKVLRSLGVKAEVKWPNDVLVGGRKVCGVLTEARGSWRVTGIGVNVNSETSRMPEELRSTATSLLELLGRPLRLPEVLIALLTELARREKQFTALGYRVPVEEYAACMAYLGQQVRVLLPDGEAVATVQGIREDGALLVVNEQGALRGVLVGEVLHVRPTEA